MPLESEHGEDPGIQALQTETAERERLEQEVRGVQKMETLGRVTGGLAHDFSNLITTITVYSELLRKQLPSGSPLLADLAQIEASAAEATGLIRSLLSLARKGTDRSEVLDLVQLVSERADLLRHLLGEHSELELRLCKQECRTTANLDQLQQVLVDLVLNARDAMASGGRLVIEVAPLDRLLQPTDELPELDRNAEYVTLVVTEEGGRDMQRAVGAGLSTVCAIVKRNGGHLRLTSAPSEGARLELFFPMASESVGSPAE